MHGNYHSMRIINIDAPEINGDCKLERIKAIQSRDFLNNMIKKAKVYTVILEEEKDYYGRFLGDIRIDGIHVSKYLIWMGKAKKYKKNIDWCAVA
tara:strand:- start:7326 stop:7610 length:285 start_codon:yes stop_codon:yes gene_type:complete